MPVSPEMAEGLAREVRDLYDEAENALLEKLAAALAADVESPRWAELKLAAVGNLRTSVEEIATALQQDTDGAVRRALVEAYGRGRQAAVAEMGGLDIGRELAAQGELPNAPAVDRLAASLADDTKPLFQRITRSVADTYRSVVARASASTLLGGLTRRQASQRALDQFAARGITGFVDRAGRSWDMASYAEMAVRSVTARAAIEGHTDALTEIGVGLVIVSDAPLECPICARWEGEVLSLNGPPGPQTIRTEHAVQRRGLLGVIAPRTAVVHVAGSLAEARAAGLFHPNCRHSLAAYLPGATTRPPHHPTPGTTYADTQRQREIERHIRRWKRRAAAAMDEPTRTAATAKIRAWQKAAREHVAAHDALRRKPEREQIQDTQPVQAADRLPNTPDEPTPTGPSDPDPPPQAVAPQGILTDVNPDTIIGAAASRVLAAIGRVHRVPDWMRSVPLREVPPRERETEQGVYQGLYRGSRLELNPDGFYLHITAAHEIGHFMDHALLGRLFNPDGRGLATSTQTTDGFLAGWWRAVSRSRLTRSFGMLKRAFKHGSPMVDYRRADGTVWSLTMDHPHVDYLATATEMFGRAYAQWIAVRSGDPVLLAELLRARDEALGREVVHARGGVRGYPGYWSDRDFVPIAEALDDVFRQLGLLGGPDG
ncbi:phage minor capsid protein [Streptomyces sp. NPDC001985]|uniref:phage minor capsid protein n=1 Tax=Streptomyces sp. NPDC001985 TaxID=3154406 RepID=UPI00331FED4E